MSRVCFIPEHPAGGCYSMYNYWEALERASEKQTRYEVKSLLPLTSPYRVGRLTKVYEKYVRYPNLVKKTRGSQVWHVLDHSWAYLQQRLPSNSVKVVTVHDLIPLDFPGDLTAGQQKRFKASVSHLVHFDALVAVSEYTKSRVVDLLEIDESKVHVIPNGIASVNENNRGSLELVDALRLRYPEALVVGSLGSCLERKNLNLLIHALKKLEEDGVHCIFIRAGDSLLESDVNGLKSIMGDRFVELGNIDSSAIDKFYQSLDLFCMPSSYEGFGLPVMEAFRWGIPVLSSDATSLPEVGGEAALYFGSNVLESLVKQLKLCSQEHIHKGLSLKIAEQVSKFSWERHLEACMDLYDNLLLAKNQ